MDTAEDWSEMESCVECRAALSPPLDRSYAVGPKAFLCWDCALRRGGHYDLLQDRWSSPPDLSGLARRALELEG